MNLRFKIKDIVILLVILTYLKPFNVSLIPWLNALYSILKVVSTCGLLIYTIRKKLTISESSKWCMTFLLWWSVSIMLNGNFISNIQILLSIFGMLLLFNVMRATSNGILIIVRCLRYVAEIYLILQLYTVIVGHPIFAEASVSFDKYFLGSDNYSAFVIIPLISFIVVDTSLWKKTLNFKTWLFIIIGFLCLALPHAWAGIFAYVILICLLIFGNSLKICQIISIRNLYILDMALLTLVMVFHIQDYIGGILGAMGKVGLSSREIIWPKAVGAFFSRPITGYGMLTEKQISAYILYGASHTHNIILEFLLSSGIVGFCLSFIWMKTALTVNREQLTAKPLKYMLYCITAYMLCGFFDFYISLIYFWVLIMCFDSLKFIFDKKRIGDRENG